MIPGVTPFNGWYSGPKHLQALDAVGYEGAEPDLRIYAVVHRREVVVLTFAALGEGGISRPFCLDVLVPVQRVQGAEERTRTADLLITSALLHMPRYTSLSGKGA